MILFDIQDLGVNPVIPSTLVGLLGLIVGYVYYFHKQKNKNELEKIKELNAEDRPKYLEQKLNDFGTTLDTSDLSPDHKYDLVKRLMNNKLKKYSISAVTLVALSLVVYLVWGKSPEELSEQSMPIESVRTFSFSSGNSSFDKMFIDSLKADSFSFSLKNPDYKIRIVSEPPGKPSHTEASFDNAEDAVDRIDYFYDSVNVSIKINVDSFSSQVIIPGTGLLPHKDEAKKKYKENYLNTIDQNFGVLYEEILQRISK